MIKKQLTDKLTHLLTQLSSDLQTTNSVQFNYIYIAPNNYSQVKPITIELR